MLRYLGRYEHLHGIGNECNSNITISCALRIRHVFFNPVETDDYDNVHTVLRINALTLLENLGELYMCIIVLHFQILTDRIVCASVFNTIVCYPLRNGDFVSFRISQANA